jgi:hypothetical protein
MSALYGLQRKKRKRGERNPHCQNPCNSCQLDKEEETWYASIGTTGEIDQNQ